MFSVQLQFIVSLMTISAPSSSIDLDRQGYLTQAALQGSTSDSNDILMSDCQTSNLNVKIHEMKFANKFMRYVRTNPPFGWYLFKNEDIWYRFEPRIKWLFEYLNDCLVIHLSRCIHNSPLNSPEIPFVSYTEQLQRSIIRHYGHNNYSVSLSFLNFIIDVNLNEPLCEYAKNFISSTYHSG